MKKILAITLCAVMLLTSVFAFASCGETKTRVKVFTEYELTAESYAFAIAKGNDELLTAANELLDDLYETGDLDKIINSFFDGTATFEYTNPVSTVPTGADKENYLIVATNAYFPPFEYYEGNKLSGVDMQLAYLLAEKLGKTLYINDMAFDTIITSVKNGESDIGMAGMTVNPARLELIDFTTEYYESAQVLIVRENDTVFAECNSATEIETKIFIQSESLFDGETKTEAIAEQIIIATEAKHDFNGETYSFLRTL